MRSRNPDTWRRHIGVVAAMCFAVVAGACSSNDKEEVAKAPECPRIGVLADAAQLVQFAGTDGDLSQLVFRAEMVNAAARCSYDDDRVDMALAVQVHAFRGNAAQPNVYPSRYFVAVVDAKEQILAREYFDLPIAFESGQDQAVLRDSVEEVRIPLKSKEAGAKYQILVGFELTPDQVIYNRVTSGTSQDGI